MRKIYSFFAILGSLAGQAQAVPVTVVPFVLEKNIIYIYCKVNEADSLKFLFDTGAGGSVINKSSQRKPSLKIAGKALNIGSNGTNEAQVSEGNTLRFGNIERSNASLTLLDYETDAFDGVFGTDLMRGNIVEIDYNTDEIRFYAQDDPKMSYLRYDKRKLFLIDNYPAVESRMIIGGKEYKGLFGLDSGADDLLTIASPFAKKHRLEKHMRNIGTAASRGSDGSVYETPIVLCPLLDFSGKYLYNIPVGLSDAAEGIDSTDKMAGFYGNNFLKRFNTIIDFKNALIYFKLNKNLYFNVYQ